MKEQKDIFISYRRKDGSVLAEAVAQLLESQGFHVFFDKDSIRFGSSFPQILEDAVKGCNEFIAIVTRNYFNEKDKKGNRRIDSDIDWVRNELRLALESKKQIFPIYVTRPPKANALPTDIRLICEKQSIFYNRVSDTLNNVVARIKVDFTNNTKENALLGSIINRLKEVDVKDNEKFNLACKDIIKLINNESDMESLYRILLRNEESKSVAQIVSNKDFRFVVLYTLLTYYRRHNMPKRIIDMVQNFGDEFIDYPFYHYVMTEYYLESAKIAMTNETMISSFLKAIEYAKSAITHIGDNNGIIHSLPFTVATALEYGVTVPKEDIRQSLINVNNVIARAPDYGGMYYSTKARLLGQLGEYEEAIKTIKMAQTMETPTHNDWMLRIATYQKQEIEIILMSKMDQLQKELDKIKNDLMQILNGKG